MWFSASTECQPLRSVKVAIGGVGYRILVPCDAGRQPVDEIVSIGHSDAVPVETVLQPAVVIVAIRHDQYGAEVRARKVGRVNLEARGSLRSFIRSQGVEVDMSRLLSNHARAWQSYNGSWPTRSHEERRSWSNFA